jgi:hypothetical protein
MRKGATTAGDETKEGRKKLREGRQDGGGNEGGMTKRNGWDDGWWNGGWQERRRIETRARRGKKGRVVRGEGGVGDAGGIGPREKGNNRSGGGNKEIGRQQGREDKRGHVM